MRVAVLTALTLAILVAVLAFGGRLGVHLDRVAGLVRAAGTDDREADTVLFSATHQRFKTRREAIAAMQDGLRALVVAESTLKARQGSYSDQVPVELFDGARLQRSGTLGPWISVEDPRSNWSAKVTNRFTVFTCSVFVGKASPTFEGHRSGEPFCIREGASPDDPSP